MLLLKDWTKLVEQKRLIVGLELRAVDRWTVFEFFKGEAEARKISCYYWNLGYSHWQEINYIKSEELGLTSSKIESGSQPNEVLSWFLAGKVKAGIYLMDDWFSPRHSGDSTEAQLQNILDNFPTNSEFYYLVLMGEQVQFSNRLKAEIPIIRYPLPNEFEVHSLVFSLGRKNLISDEPNTLKELVVACQGLAAGEIKLVLNTYAAFAQDVSHLTRLILNYKTTLLQGLGLEFIAQPDVEYAGGLDLLQQYLYDTVVKLNEPSAALYNLRPPRGMLLMGPPGTGKTLCAKLAAKALNYSLLGLSWGNVLGADNPDFTLARILEIADTLDRCILLADDFDKGFTGWEKGGVSRRLSQRLLTWMQEHDSHVLMIATVNRIQLLPSEIKRRFDDGGIWFVDLPHLGALYEIFQIHLKKYYPQQFKDEGNFTTEQWRDLLKQYWGATPVEVANAVQRCAINFYCNLSDEGRSGGIEPHITIEELEAQLSQFQMASVRDSEDIQLIRNQAYYACPASSSDHTKFAIKGVQLFSPEL